MQKAETPGDAEAMRAAFDGPAVAANRFIVTMGPTVRIAFCEQVPGLAPRFRAAVALAHRDAVGLSRVLRHVLAGVERQIEAAEQRPPKRSVQ